MIWYNPIWYDMIWYDMIWYDMIWYDMIWYDMIWYDMIWDCIDLNICFFNTLYFSPSLNRNNTWNSYGSGLTIDKGYPVDIVAFFHFSIYTIYTP